MRIGIDASRAFGKERTGTENYSYEIITRLLKLPETKEHEWILYTKENIKLPYLWTQIGLAFKTWTDNLDVLWVPAHTLPVFRKPGIKTVITIHGIEYEWLPAYENWLQRWYLPLSTKYACWAADKIIAVSEFTKKQLVERLKADTNKITIIHEGISSTSLSNLPPKLGGRSKWGVLPGKYILFIGTIQPRKNLVRLIQAFSTFYYLLSIKLVIAGKLGWNYQEVLDEAKKNKNVIITGYISDMERDSLLRHALVYVQPSITEGFGLPVLEAMKAGVPVVSSNGGALPEIVGDAGLLFDPLDQLDILDKLDQILSNPKLRKSLIAKGRLRAKEFSWDKAARQTYNILTNF